MTDSEKAEKYFEDSKDYYDSRELITDRQLRQIYLDGLAEGRKEKWHDLRKNSNDLPKESGEYWCKLKEKRRYAFEVYYKESLFYKSRWEELGVIAWCELPEFEE